MVGYLLSYLQTRMILAILFHMYRQNQVDYPLLIMCMPLPIWSIP